MQSRDVAQHAVGEHCVGPSWKVWCCGWINISA